MEICTFRYPVTAKKRNESKEIKKKRCIRTGKSRLEESTRPEKFAPPTTVRLHSTHLSCIEVHAGSFGGRVARMGSKEELTFTVGWSKVHTQWQESFGGVYRPRRARTCLRRRPQSDCTHSLSCHWGSFQVQCEGKWRGEIERGAYLHSELIQGAYVLWKVTDAF